MGLKAVDTAFVHAAQTIVFALCSPVLSTVWLKRQAAGLGGVYGGRLPDVLEPATSSWHRSLAHSGAAGGAIVATRSALMEWQKFCRERAEYCGIQAEQNGELVMVPDPLSLPRSTYR